MFRLCSVLIHIKGNNIYPMTFCCGLRFYHLTWCTLLTFKADYQLESWEPDHHQNQGHLHHTWRQAPLTITSQWVSLSVKPRTWSSLIITLRYLAKLSYKMCMFKKNNKKKCIIKNQLRLSAMYVHVMHSALLYTLVDENQVIIL